MASSVRQLSPEDQAFMRRNIQNGRYIGIPVCLLLAALGLAIAWLFWHNGVYNLKYVVGMIAGLGMALVLLFFVWLIIRGTAMQEAELRTGLKYVFRDVIVRKEIRDSHRRDDTDADGLMARRDHIRTWYLHTDQEAYEVSPEIYEVIEEGQEVEIQLAPESGLLLRIRPFDPDGEDHVH